MITSVYQLTITSMVLILAAQVEVHPLWRNDELIAYSNAEGIHVSAYCPMGTPWTSAKVQSPNLNPRNAASCMCTTKNLSPPPPPPSQDYSRGV